MDDLQTRMGAILNDPEMMKKISAAAILMMLNSPLNLPFILPMTKKNVSFFQARSITGSLNRTAGTTI